MPTQLRGNTIKPYIDTIFLFFAIVSMAGLMGVIEGVFSYAAKNPIGPVLLFN